MKTAVGALLLVPTLTLLGACASAEPDEDEPTPVRTLGPSSPTPSDPGSSAAAEGDACDEVVAGIDAFNQGDFDATVRHFELAVPLAEAEAAADPSQRARDLLEAVRYYADLPAADYPAASLDSAEFEKYKQITLGQCASDGGGQDGGPGGDGGVIA